MLRRSFFICAASAFKHQVAIVGSGPSGCYVAQQLLKSHDSLHIDIYERLPVPFGLSRYGVAPDHPEVKNVEKTFLTQVLNNTERCSLLCNVEVGKDVTVHQLCTAYSAVVFASGAAGERALGIRGEHGISNVVGSRRFVEWYNTMPYPAGSPLTCPLENLAAGAQQQRTQHARQNEINHVVLVGNGNVALDIARVLSAPYKHFCPTDMNCFAVRDLLHSSVRRVTIVARRNVEHAAFTIKEFRELTTIAPPPAPPGVAMIQAATATGEERVKQQDREEWAKEVSKSVKVVVEPFDLEAALKRAESDPAVKQQGLRRKLELMKKFEVSSFDDPAIKNFPGRVIVFRFGLTPNQILAAGPRPAPESAASSSISSSARSGIPRVGGMAFSYTYPPDDAGTTAPSSAGEQKTLAYLPCEAVITCAGYLGEPVHGGVLPFDEARSVIPTEQDSGRVLPLEKWRHVYAVGWARYGPRGVIASSLADAQRVAKTIVDDLNKWDEEREKKSGALKDSCLSSSSSPPPPLQVEELAASSDASETLASDKAEEETVTEGQVRDEIEAYRRRNFRRTGCLHFFEEFSSSPPRGKYDLVDDFVARRVLPLGLQAVRRIWRVEVERGVDLGKSLEKINSKADMLNIAGGGRLATKTEQRVRGKYIGGRPAGLELMEEYLDSTTMLVDASSENGIDIPSTLKPSSSSSAAQGPNLAQLEPHHTRKGQ